MEDLGFIFKAIDKVRVGEEERKELNFKVEGSTLTWNPEKEEDEKEFEFSGEEKRVLMGLLKKIDDDKAWAVDSKPLYEIYEELRK